MKKTSACGGMRSNMNAQSEPSHEEGRTHEHQTNTIQHRLHQRRHRHHLQIRTYTSIQRHHRGPDMNNKKWGEDKDEDGEIIKLEIGETIEGIIIDKGHSTRYDADIIKIKAKDDGTPKVIICTTILEKRIKNKEIGEEILIERINDIINSKKQPTHNYKTYHRTEEAE